MNSQIRPADRTIALADVALLVATLVTLSLSWQRIGRTTIVCAGLAALRFAWRRSARSLLVYGFGFVFASLAEIVQVWAGLYDYAQASPVVIPCYNFFLWGVVLLAARLAFFYSPGDVWFLLVGVLLGPLVEGFWVHLGIYRFADPEIGNLPLWHPIYWGLIVLYLRRMARAQDEHHEGVLLRSSCR